MNRKIYAHKIERWGNKIQELQRMAAIPKTELDEELRAQTEALRVKIAAARSKLNESRVRRSY